MEVRPTLTMICNARERGYWQEHQEELKSKVLTHYLQCASPSMRESV